MPDQAVTEERGQNQAERADRVIVLHRGHVLTTGSPQALVEETQTADLHDAFVSLTGPEEE